jgi:AcrR family transcriptional regulator
MKHDMNAAAPTLRSAHRDLTRGRILDAALELLETEEAEQLTIAGIAAKAGVTERTIYRHFSTRDELFAAVWPRMQGMVRSRGFPKTAAALIEQPLHLFPNFDEREGPIRASVFSKAGRELRLAVNEERQAAFLACARDAWPKRKDQEARNLAAVLQLLDSAYAWALLKDHWGMDGREAARAVSDAIAVLVGRPPAADIQEEGKTS